jgi:N-acetylneuraminic acid mutarotase
MRKWCLVLTLMVCCLLGSSIFACSRGGSEDPGSSNADPSVTGASATSTTTLPPATWETVAATGALPPGRLGASLVAAPTGGTLLLFGGWVGGTDYSDSLWSYDSATSTWTELFQGGDLPAARATQAVVYEPTGNRLIVFGGRDSATYFGDTWAYNLDDNTWTELRPVGTVPAARAGHSLVYDPVSKRVILFGGWNGVNQYNDTWAYDPVTNAWTNLRPGGRVPAARDSQAMAYDPTSKRMILFGGWNTTMEYNDTWSYDPAANEWDELDPSGELPPARALEQMAYDASVEKMVLFGGGTSTAVFGDTWDYDAGGNTWTQVTLTGESPAARTGYALQYDPTQRKLILFAGYNGVTFFGDLWTLTR